MKKLLLFFVITICNFSLFSFHVSAQYTKLIDFAGNTNGNWPSGSLLSYGSFLYGMTTMGGTNNFGTIFKLKPDGSGYVKLLDFDGITKGSIPYGSLISDSIFLYGMTEQGGTNNLGTVFKIKLDGSGYIKLLDFSAINGSSPYGSLISDGNFLYGMTTGGGPYNEGVIFKIKSDGSGYTKLLDFTGTNGSDPSGSLLYDGTFLYGMTIIGGINDKGVAFKIKPDGSNYVKLLDFGGISNGAMPYGSLISDGTFLYGMTYQGGINNLGTIFKIKPDGNNYLKLLDFEGASNGSKPYDSFLLDSGFLYGMTMTGGTFNDGVIFKIKTDGSSYEKLVDFAGVSNGSVPRGTLISDGSFLYGMTSTGGTNDFGVVFLLGTSLGIDTTKNNNFYACPNPASNVITIVSTSRSKSATLSIYSIHGQMLMQQPIQKSITVLDVSMLAKGLYILMLYDNEKTEVTRIVKN